MADYEQLFSEYYDLVFRFLLRRCKDPALAEDLTQETFFRAYMNLGQLRERDKAPAWLCQIAKNAFCAWYNENRRFTELEDDIAADTPDPAEAFFRKEASKEAFARLHELEEPYREVFMLSVFAGLSLTEISALFGKSESWARVTFYRARKKLREMLR